MNARSITALSMISILIPAFVYAANTSSIDDRASLVQVESNLTTYDSIFPYYTMQCSYSRYRQEDGYKSSIMGHTSLYIKGACRDKSVPYPKLKMCDSEDSNTGVGLSVEKITSNTQYVPTDGIDFFLNGTSTPNEPVNVDVVKSTIAAYVASGALNGVKIHDENMKKKPADQTLPEYIAWVGLATDFAMSMGRDMTCTRIPMTQAQIQAEVDYVNATNEPYVTEAKEYQWNAAGDNCAHFAHDVLSAAGVRSEVTRSDKTSRDLLNFFTFQWEIPNNDVLLDMEFANDLSKIGTAEEVYKDHSEREAFNRLGSLPRLGATIETIPMHVLDNSMYKLNTPDTVMFDFPLIRDRRHKMKSMEKNAIYSHVSDNLQSVLARLQEIQGLTKLHEQSSVSSPAPSPSPDAASDADGLADFTARYNAWIDQTILDVQAKLAKISQLNVE